MRPDCEEAIRFLKKKKQKQKDGHISQNTSRPVGLEPTVA